MRRRTAEASVWVAVVAAASTRLQQGAAAPSPAAAGDRRERGCEERE